MPRRLVLRIVARLHHLLGHAPAGDLDRAAHWVTLRLRRADGNAGLGLLEMFYRSNRNLKYNINKLSENIFAYNINIELSQQLVPQN